MFDQASAESLDPHRLAHPTGDAQRLDAGAPARRSGPAGA
jgi:hypothetical protein